MIVVKLQGGLGNQMFQYAFGRSLSLETGIPIALDAAGLENGEGITRRHYSLGAFKCESYLIDEEELLRFRSEAVSLTENQEEDPSNFVSCLDKNKDYYLIGYWQGEKYFKKYSEAIRSDFTLRNPLSDEAAKYLETITMNQGQSIAVQVRRGDYINNKKVADLIGACGKEYYEVGVNFIINELDLKSPRIFVFSDDIGWCEKNLSFPSDMVYISKDRLPDYEELFLISRAKHVVISNSSFGWWGAWLNQNPDKIIVAPKHWAKNAKLNRPDITPPSWIRT